MSLSNADLLAISNLLDQKFEPLERRISSLENRLDRLEKRFDNLEKRFDNLEKRFDNLEKRFDNLEKRFDDLEKRFDDLEKEVKSIKFQIDHDIVPRLSTIESCYLGTYERYLKAAEKIERYMEKQDILTGIVMEHEQKLKRLGV